MENLSSLIQPDFYFNPSTLREVTLKVDAVKGLNLGQGVCQLPTPPYLIEQAAKAMRDGYNRYTPSCGFLPLRESIASQLQKDQKLKVTADNIIVTHGSTGAFEIICQSFLKQGDKAVVFSPYYPYHVNALRRRGVEIDTVEIDIHTGVFSFEDLKKTLSNRPKILVICNPSNPSGKVFSLIELQTIQEYCEEFGVLVITDEVYEYLTYDGLPHVSMASLPGAFANTITMGSFSKTFSITGWRLGYICAPVEVFRHLNSLADQIYVCPPAPLQIALKETLDHLDQSYYVDLQAKYQKNRDQLATILRTFGFDPIIPQGAYYLLAEFSKKFPGKTASEVVEILIKNHSLGSIAASDFIGHQFKDDAKRNSWLRFNFSIPDSDFMRLEILLK